MGLKHLSMCVLANGIGLWQSKLKQREHENALLTQMLTSKMKELEEKWDVKAGGGAVVMAGPAGGDGAGAAEEPTEFDVILTSAGAKKIQVIKEIRAITSLGLKEAKALVDDAPSPVKQNLEKAEADALKERLEATGAGVEVKPS